MEASKLIESSHEIHLLYQNGNFESCHEKLQDLQKGVTKVDRAHISSEVFSKLCSVLKTEVDKWTECNDYIPELENLNIVSTLLCCIRNSFAHCTHTQDLVSGTPTFLDPVLSCIRWTVTSPLSASTSQDDISEAYDALASSCITCLGNLVAANPTSRKLVWPLVTPFLSSVLAFRKWKVAQMGCVFLHHCILEPSIKNQFVQSADLANILDSLASLYHHESNFACFVLFCLRLLLTSDAVLEQHWVNLGHQTQHLCLDVLGHIVDEPADVACPPPSTETVVFLKQQFKTVSDLILRTHASYEADHEVTVVTALLRFLNTVASSDQFRQILQNDTSLLITSVYLLRCIQDIGESGNNAFTPLSSAEVNITEGDINAHPAFGFKCDLIRLIASLVYRNTENQDKVRELDGLMLLLGQTRFDQRNPLIKENAVFALRNLLEDNPQNQQVIADLNMQGIAPNEGLRELGMVAEVGQDGKISVRQVRHNGNQPRYQDDDAEL
ncbi:ataxin-10 [Oratosquilla oratoria]|uniref:ataxin-10 n=1 Tax=Oratosquilla oratoria TaxID=337810 RepID=UPI003F7689ED